MKKILRSKQIGLASVAAVSVFLLGLVLPGHAQSDSVGTIPPSSTPAPVAAATSLDGSETISLDFKDADIRTVLRVLSLKSRVNIVAGPEVEGIVTIRLEDVPWQKALEVVLRTYDYVFERDGNIIRVTSRERMAQEPVLTQTVVLNYSKANETMDSIKDMLSERGRIRPADRTNALVITDIPTNLYRITEVIKKLDQITPQAYIDSKIVKTDVGQTENLGIQWNIVGGLTRGASRPTTFPFPTRVNQAGDDRVFSGLFGQFLPSGSAATDPRDFPAMDITDINPGFTYGTLNFTDFSSVLQMLQSKTNTKVVSNPRIIVLNNQTAKVQVGSQIPVPSFERNSQTGDMEVTGFTYRDVGVVLNVTPHINSAEEILVELKPEVSSRGADVSFGTTFSAPSFVITTANTQVLIQSGQTIAIGGLLTDNVQVGESRVPYISDIPLIGKLFRSKRQTAGEGNAKVETLFFVTVTTVDTEGQPIGKAVAQRAGLAATPSPSTTRNEGDGPTAEEKFFAATHQPEGTEQPSEIVSSGVAP
jgi:type IV pilus assembly protein PilQ